MASGGYGPIIRQVERLLEGGGTAVALGEGQLLRRFADDRDEAAFEALVSRHGPMVLGTCRRMLSDPHDVDDAFQATFLVLARKAGSIRDGDRLGPWLHGVARRVATRSRALAARRNARERPGTEDRAVSESDTSEALDLRSALDEELARLPEKYRAPLVLCYLEGLTHDEAARQLRWPVGTVRSRLAGGRDRLRSRLTRRGLSPSAAVPAALPAAAMPEALLSSTVRVATLAGSAPAHVASLAKGAMIAMIWHKLKLIAAVGLLAGLAAGGAGVLAIPGGSGRAVADPAIASPAKVDPVQAPPGSDDLARLQGRWKIVEVNSALGDTPARFADTEWVIEGRSLVTMAGDKEVNRMELTLGEEGGAKTIDTVRYHIGGSKTISRGLYRLEGDTFEICVGGPNRPRPTEFKGGERYPLLITFKRQGGSPRPDLAGPKAEQLTGELDTARKEVKRLQAELQSAQSRLVRLTRQAEKSRPEPAKGAAPAGATGKAEAAKPDDQPPASTAPAADPFARPASPGADSRPAQPRVMTLQGNPALFAVISAERDRVTMIDSVTQERSSFRLPRGAKQITPVDGMLVSLIIKGPEVTRTALYDRLARRWYEYDLKEPATEVIAWSGGGGGGSMSIRGDEPFALQIKGPEVGRLAVFDPQDKKWATIDLPVPAKGGVAPSMTRTTATYLVGRVVYIYNVLTKGWSTLQLTRPDVPIPGMDGNGKMVLPDGDLIHIYDAKTGEWTHIDTRDEK